MRKDRKQQKNGRLTTKESGQQTILFRYPGSTGKRQETGVELSSRLSTQRSLTVNLLDEIVAYDNLDRAHRQVVSNGGSSGIDKMDVKGLGIWLNTHLSWLRQSLLTEQYEVSGVRKVEIDKPDGGTRTLGIPTVKDRYIQQAISQVLTRYYDPHFSDHSYGFRPGRNAHQAIHQASHYIQSGKEWVVDLDLEKFFDKINHDRLMQRLGKGIGDKRVLRLINCYLRAGLMSEGLEEQRIAGTPQGGPLSPLLSNIVLDELDRELEKRGHSFCRYADDCNIYVKSKKAGERVLQTVTDFIETKLKLKVNRVKSGVRHCSNTKFLGYTLLPEGGIRISDQSINRLKDKIREITQRNKGVSFEQRILELNQVIIGWSSYYRLANKWLGELRNIDGWLRRRLRCCKLKQSKRPYTIFKLLKSHGMPTSLSWNAIKYTQGWWDLSTKIAVSKAMGKDWFNRQGLQSLYKRIPG